VLRQKGSVMTTIPAGESKVAMAAPAHAHTAAHKKAMKAVLGDMMKKNPPTPAQPNCVCMCVS
jgi:hypothetical protein